MDNHTLIKRNTFNQEQMYAKESMTISGSIHLGESCAYDLEWKLYTFKNFSVSS